MMHSYFANPLIFVVETLFYLYMLVLALRIIMQWAHWEYHHPIVQFIIRVTQPPIKFLRQYVPAIGRWDTATIVLLLLVILLKLTVISLISGSTLNIFVLVRLLLADIISLFINIFIVSIIVEVILSWLAVTGGYNPIMSLISKMNAPLLRPVRRWLPDLGGIDLSPLFVLIGLQVLLMLIMPLLTGQL